MFYFYLSVIENEEERNIIRTLYNDERAVCLHIAIKITKDKAIAEEAVQNAFVKIIEQKDKFFEIPIDKRHAFIVTVVKNKAIDLLRAQRTSTQLFNEDNEEMFGGDYDISVDLESEEAFEQLKKLIKALPEKYKTVFELKYIHDMSNGEISTILGISKEMVSLRLTRAKQKLRKALKDGEKQYGLQGY